MRDIARHEATHTYFCVKLDIPFNWVTIVPGDEYKGRVDTIGLDEILNLEDIELKFKYAIMFVSIHFRKEFGPDPEYIYAKMILNSIMGTGDADESILREKYNTFVSENCSDIDEKIDILTDELLRRKTMTREEIMKLWEEPN